MTTFSASNVRPRDRLYLHCLLHETIEELPALPGRSPIEAKGEFVENGLEHYSLGLLESTGYPLPQNRAFQISANTTA